MNKIKRILSAMMLSSALFGAAIAAPLATPHIVMADENDGSADDVIRIILIDVSEEECQKDPDACFPPPSVS
ncbi:MAG: hypothetical protein KIH69_003515, partial [Anaerolineae bacterium]|nr:hypothetical protein [Anaerolineae bacterium]